MTDERIIELFFGRSEDAIKELSAKYGKLLMSLAYNVTGNLEDAEECCSDAYLGVWNRIPPERPSPLSAYVCRVVRNLAHKKYEYNKARRRNSEYTVAINELTTAVASEGAVEDEITADELALAIDAFLDMEKPTDRELFVRRYYFAETVDEAAKALLMKPNRAAVALHRQRERLRRYLIEEGYII